MRYEQGETVRIIYESKRLLTGLTTKITVWDNGMNVVVNDQNMTELSNGIYYYDYVPSANGNFTYMCDCTAQPRRLTGLFYVDDTLTFLKDIEGGKWQIVGNQMVFYNQTGDEVVATFNLFNNAGNPAMTNIYKRERV